MAAERIGVTVAVTAASKITELLVDPTRHQFRYIFRFHSIVGEFRREEKNLTSAHNRVQNEINNALRNAEEIEKDVEEWMTEVKTVMGDVQQLNGEIEIHIHSNKLCSCWIWHYGLSKKVAEKTLNLKKLRERGKFEKVSYHAPLLAIEFLPSKDFTPSKPSREAFNQIFEALNDDGVNMIGLYGMAGVGKTTLAKEVGRKAMVLKLFDQVLMVAVSQAQDTIKIQDQLADKLGLHFDEKSKVGRASRLWQRLKSEKKMLIILDDVWKNLNLKDIGILYSDDHKGCKILLTTRICHVCTLLGCQRVVKLNVLTENEAWTLFKKNAGLQGNCVLNNVAMKVARECKGLPIAIVTLGRALRGKNFSGWKLALQKLKNSRLVDIRDVDKNNNAYACLKLSFDNLQCEQTKLLLLLCSLFPEDHEIFVEDLARLAVGLGLYKDAQSIDDVGSEVYEAIGDLKASCMLLETESEGHVKMHDMVCDFAQWIGSTIENAFRVRARIGVGEWPKIENSENYSAISLMDKNLIEIPDKLVFPKLELLLLAKRTIFSTEETVGVRDTSFDGVKELKALSLDHVSLSVQSLRGLTNLQALELKNCYISSSISGKKVADFALYQKLKQLKILSFCGSSIEALPEEIGELDNLRVLDLRCCKLLMKIPAKMIRRLSKLEELYIGSSSFKQWEAEGICKQGNNASLMELKLLSLLAVVWLNFDEHIQRDFVFPNLDGYYVHINCGCAHDNSLSLRFPMSRTICLRPNDINSLMVCKNLLPTAYVFHLFNSTSFQNIMPEMDQRGFNDLICLKLLLCEVGCLINTKQHQAPTIAFSNLEAIDICKTDLKEICHGPPAERFLEKLEKLKMYACRRMSAIFPEKLWKALENLRTVIVQRCSDLQEVFEFPRLDRANTKLLSCLTTLELQELPELRCIFKGPSDHVSLKNLTHLILNSCGNLTSIFSTSVAQSLVHLQTLYIGSCDQLEHIITEKGQETVSEAHSQPQTLQNLKTLTIYECKKLEYIFPISMAQGLLHLEKIIVAHAVQLREFFRKEGRDTLSIDVTNNVIPPQNMEHKCLSTHSYFCTGSPTAVFPSLRHLEFTECPKLSMHSVDEILFPPKDSTNPEKSKIRYLDEMQMKSQFVVECGELEHAIDEDDESEKYQPLFNSYKSYFRHTCFSNLLYVKVYNCDKLKHLFPITVAQGLPHLEYLEVGLAYQLVEVFRAEDEADSDSNKEIIFAKLQTIRLEELPSLLSFCPAGFQLTCPSLEDILVAGCPNLKTSFAGGDSFC